MKFVQLCAMNTTAMNAPETMMRSSMPRETMPASRRVGLRSIRLSRIGSIPSVSAGGPSMMMLTHSSCNAVNGAARPLNSEASTTTTEDRFTVSWNWMNRWKFS